MPEPTSISIAFLLYPNVTQLDLTGPAQVLSRIGKQKLDLVWKDRAPVATDAGFSIVPTATFDEVRSADILCVPGGFGCIDMMEDEETLAWLRDVAAGAQWVTSVCTGSLVLGAAGLLRGYRAAGIDFALALTAAIRGEAHARAVQLSLEYDPAPPFDSGSPERAGEALVDFIRARSRKLAPDREARIEAVAARLEARAE
jgi:cyclohexyl-isocyanide hydratase